MPNMDEEEMDYERTSVNFVDNAGKYKIQKYNYNRQYYILYNKRLQSMIKILQKRARQKWGRDVDIRKVDGISGDEEVCVIGTLFKNMTHQPSILKEISEEEEMIPHPVRENYSDETDELVIEDEVQRIKLSGNIDVHSHVSGVMVALLGREIESGIFNVKDVCYPLLAEQPQRPILGEDKYIALVSGLCIYPESSVLTPLTLFSDFLGGNLGGDLKKISRIAHLVICGNSITAKDRNKDTTKGKYLLKDNKASTIESIHVLDDVLSKLATQMNVAIMPGENDPANYLLPQQPFKTCLFTKTSQYDSFHSLTNPCDITVEGIKIIGSSGQNLSNMKKYSRLQNSLECLEKVLEWGHTFPTAPDTLGCYPFEDKDPFILEECPHVLFAGNQPTYDSKLYEGSEGQLVRLVCIPTFTDTHVAVLLNLRTLECEPVQFDLPTA